MTSTPFLPTPSWLDPQSEIVDPDQPPAFQRLNDVDKAITFILNSLKGILAATTSISFALAIEVIANSVGETGWGKSHRGRNFGGWKINKSDVDRAKASGGKCPPWWKALGHVLSGDAPVVYYRGFPSVDRFYVEWIERFVPRNAAPTHRYYKTGRVFWGVEQGDWFRELCLAGYKGPVTEANPDNSVRNHKTIAQGVKTRLAQKFLGVTPDGVWGSKSREACLKFQAGRGISATGECDLATLELLIKDWKSAGMPLPVAL